VLATAGEALVTLQVEGKATFHWIARKKETPLAGRRADDSVAGGVMEI
jgi:hypothetical protein